MAAEESRALALRFLRGYGIAAAPLSEASQLLPSSPRPFVLVGSETEAGNALDFLTTLTFPATRHVVFPAGPRHTAFVNNSRNGSDYADYVQQIPRHLNCRFLRVVSSERRTWSNGVTKELLDYEARIFELHDSDGREIRSIDCMEDGGRWSFGTSGTPHAIEATFPYDAKRKRDRFSADHLAQLIGAFGFPLVNEQVLCSADRYLLFQSPCARAEADACSIAEADDPAYGYYHRGLTWTKHMQSHAASVIADFERCVRLNPEYEPKVRGYLREAYLVLGKSPET